MFARFGLNTLKKHFNMKPAQMHPITFKRVWDCFFPKNEWDYYSYLGYIDFLYTKGTKKYELVENFVKYVDNKAKPTWCPRFVLRLLHMYGNDSSIVRCRSQRVSRWHGILLKGIFIRDMKTKWDNWDIRIYGSFTDDIYSKIDELEENISQLKP